MKSFITPKGYAKTLRQKDQVWTILWKAKMHRRSNFLLQAIGIEEKNLSGKHTEAY